MSKDTSSQHKMLSKKGKILEISIALLFIVGGVLLRLAPHWPNFTPIVAIALFGGFYLSRRIAWFLPMVIMIIADFFIGFYQPELMISVYGSFLLAVLLGFWLKKHKKWYNIGGSAIVAAILFFVITNFGTWAFTPWYSKTFAGLMQCYTMALPFFRNSLIASVLYTGAFFGAYELVELWLKNKFTVSEQVSEA